MRAPELISGRHGPIAYRCSHGLREPPNEDALYLNTGADIFAVVDGMGGYERGEDAARILAEACQVMAQKLHWLTETNAAALQATAHQQMKGASLGEGGACYAAFQLVGNQLHVAHAGDVKVVVLDERGVLLFETQDHRSGHYITNAVTGISPGEVYYQQQTIRNGYRIIAASDGLWNILSVQEAAKASRGKEPLAALRALERKALDLQGECSAEDNITILLYDISLAPPAREKQQVYKILRHGPRARKPVKEAA